MVISTIDTTREENKVLIDNAPGSLLLLNEKKINEKIEIIHKKYICEYQNLSEKYNYKISTFESGKSNNSLEAVNIAIELINKQNQKKQKINIPLETNFLFLKGYQNCESARSYVTNINSDKEVPDNDHGYFVIADFNFDSEDDFAITIESGGNGGPIYAYYLQDTNGLFKKDAYLTNKMKFFPINIDTANKSLTTTVHASAFGYIKTTSKYINKKWKVIECDYIDFENR